MDTNTVDNNAIELQRQVQKLEKLEKMINPNSKKSLILWEEDDSFKALIASIVKYSLECDTQEAFPVELLDKLNALKEDVKTQITDSKAKVASLNIQATKNLELSRLLSTIYISAMAANPLDEYEEVLSTGELASVKECLQTIATCVPDSEEYTKAEKTVKSKISNLENSVHITIDLERTTSKAGALEYIGKEIAPAIERLQTAYDAKYAVAGDEAEDIEMSLALRKTLKEKVYDAVIKPFANLFKWKKKAKN
ncbi:MAG: hypothetical protein IJ220_04510 [Clostridia bacterium]|nr:hypothetical protein [Clostridia bacterium]